VTGGAPEKGQTQTRGVSCDNFNKRTHTQGVHALSSLLNDCLMVVLKYLPSWHNIRDEEMPCK